MEKLNKNFTLVVSIAFFVILITILPSTLNGNSEEIERQELMNNDGVISPQSASSHAPISLDGNSSLDSFCTIGSGTEEEPYIIENYEIDAASAHGIEIMNTSAYLEIRSCVITNSLTNMNYGIYLMNCSNVNISNNDLSDNFIEILLYNSDFNIVSDNLCSSTDFGIYLANSDNNIVSDNTCSGHFYEIVLEFSDYNTLSGNTCTGTDSGILLLDSKNNNILVNHCSSSIYGINLQGSLNNNITENSCINNDYGIYMNHSYSNILLENNFSFNTQHGIYIWNFADYNTLTGNLCSFNEIYGLLLHDSDQNSISENIFSNNGYGIRLLSSSDNEIWNNLFMDNIGFQVSPYEELNENLWDNGTIGNYWSDYIDKYYNAQVESNGITWDRPYVVGTLNVDNYPLVTPTTIAEDTDGDGLYDNTEIYNYGCDPTMNDTDNDGLSDDVEVNSGTNPTNPDTDNDLMPDKWEIDNGLDPLTFNPWEDPDEDGITNLDEFIKGTDPNQFDGSGIAGYSPFVLIGVAFFGTIFILLKSKNRVAQ
jgi:parallel beta-helix repeat protein